MRQDVGRLPEFHLFSLNRTPPWSRCCRHPLSRECFHHRHHHHQQWRQQYHCQHCKHYWNQMITSNTIYKEAYFLCILDFSTQNWQLTTQQIWSLHDHWSQGNDLSLEESNLLPWPPKSTGNWFSSWLFRSCTILALHLRVYFFFNVPILRCKGGPAFSNNHQVKSRSSCQESAQSTLSWVDAKPNWQGMRIRVDRQSCTCWTKT